MRQILNLAYPDRSWIKFQISQFPDGQQSITITDPASIVGTKVMIESRMNSFQDVELIICATQALRTFAKQMDIELFVPYFLGARSDRKFTDGGINYLKTVICPIINSQNFSKVTVVDPHSDVLEACLNNFHKLDNHELVYNAIGDITKKNIKSGGDEIILVSPDAGAYKKIFDIGKRFRIDNIITATKVRDIWTGKIVHTDVPLASPSYYNGMKFVIVDDICDGGRTFVELARSIREKISDAEIYLVVTHGIFSAGFEMLGNDIRRIYTTNSISDVNNDNVNSLNIFSL